MRNPRVELLFTYRRRNFGLKGLSCYNIKSRTVFIISYRDEKPNTAPFLDNADIYVGVNFLHREISTPYKFYAYIKSGQTSSLGKLGFFVQFVLEKTVYRIPTSFSFIRKENMSIDKLLLCTYLWSWKSSKNFYPYEYPSRRSHLFFVEIIVSGYTWYEQKGNRQRRKGGAWSFS